MKWYDVFSNVYDNALEKLYFETRKIAAEKLDLKNAKMILDVACGTGANFRHFRKLNDKIVIYGTDFSTGMLGKAQMLVDKNNWKNIVLFQADARNLNPSTIQNYTGKPVTFDRVTCVLGLSVIPEWEKVLDNMISLLRPNGKIVIVDVFAERRNFNSWLVEKIARADLSRPIWQTLERKTKNFTCEYVPIKESKVGGKLFVATGMKK